MSAPVTSRSPGVDFRDPTPRRRRRRRIVIGSLLLVGLAAGVWLIWFSPVLQVREVRVVGVEGVRADEVLAAAAVPTGTPLARIDASSAERGIGELPWVSAVEVRRGWPSEVVLAVEVREPIAVLDAAAAAALGVPVSSAGATLGIDAEAVVFESVGPLPRKLPKVRAEGAALSAVMTVVNGLPPDLLKRVVSITATTRDDIDLNLRSGDVVRWGSALESEEKVEVLRALLGRKADLYDVSAPELPTTFRLG